MTTEVQSRIAGAPMAGGAELESLAHELERTMGSSNDIVAELRAEVEAEAK